MRDVVVVGAGPAGMSAALELRGLGLDVVAIDDQPTAGGRIFANIERRAAHGVDDRRGKALVERFKAAGGDHVAGAEVWQIEPEGRVFITRRGQASTIETRFVLLATGAQERPMPFPGWQLPGVMTVGGAQLLLKTAREIPDGPVWFAGCGPLLLLYVRQLIEAGGEVAGILDTSRPDPAAAARAAPGALPYGWRELARGAVWLASNRLRAIRTIRGVTALKATGYSRLEGLRYLTREGGRGSVDATTLLIHDGVVPGMHAPLSVGCDHQWNAVEACHQPVVDGFGGTSKPRIFVAGDAGGIAGARAAIDSGRLAALGIATAAGAIAAADAERLAKPFRRRLRAAGRFRRLLDELYPPSRLALPDDTIACRCEEVTAGRLREAACARPRLGLDGLKIETRAGMGPCQGRMCGATMARLLAEAAGGAGGDLGPLRVRPPLKPLTLAELAGLDAS